MGASVTCLPVLHPTPTSQEQRSQGICTPSSAGHGWNCREDTFSSPAVRPAIGPDRQDKSLDRELPGNQVLIPRVGKGGLPHLCSRSLAGSSAPLGSCSGCPIQCTVRPVVSSTCRRQEVGGTGTLDREASCQHRPTQVRERWLPDHLSSLMEFSARWVSPFPMLR
jgi:hypothetical protein